MRSVGARLTSLFVLLTAIILTVFAGSLYLLALTHIRALAWITPVGGVVLMAGWLGLIALGVLRWRATDDR